MQKFTSDLSFEDDSNLRNVQPNPVNKQKPDSYYLEEINKISCNNSDILVQDNSDNTYQNDNYYCYNNGPTKKLVQWKKVDKLWVPKHLTHTSEYKEIAGTVCKVLTESCDSFNPSQGCNVKCFLDDKTVKTFTANYMALP